MLKLNYFKEFQTLAEFLAQLYSKEAEIFRTRDFIEIEVSVWNSGNVRNLPLVYKEQH